VEIIDAIAAGAWSTKPTCGLIPGLLYRFKVRLIRAIARFGPFVSLEK